TLAAHSVRVAMVGLGKRKSGRLPENLGPDARAPLEKLGLWERFVAEGHPRCWAALSAWGSGELRERNSIRNASGAGWLIDRDRLDPWMRSACARAGVPWFARCPSGLVKRGSAREPRSALVAGGSERAREWTARGGDGVVTPPRCFRLASPRDEGS